ncbi:BTB/POZ domain-containing protein KCTD19-like [Hypomesus transpacificus]|uniref:BTB/POZ domain-containing protein KCTD19-like n=1 Tax=Hypomesus transpacificus TaxID=137520 RepID=UPI001F07AC1D|nr:BTB/POZ domain-containing protein KCTD19-like [Hypomesus transpacificus]
MADRSANQSCFFNVGGCFFSIPRARLSYLQDSLLFKDSQNQGRWFIDRDGCTFRHVQYYLQTGKLATSCSSELNILYELTASLRLSSLLQALEHFQSGKHYLRARPVDLQVAERATLNYWKTRICNKKQPEVIASPVSSVHDAVPLGLIGTPLIDGDEEVLYCFLPMEQIRLYPHLVTAHNLLWLCDNVAIIECDSPLFRFIANFLQTGKMLLPEQFSDYERLKTEARSSGMFDFMKALQVSHEASFDGDFPPAARTSELSTPQPPKPLYEMTFDLLVRYQDSALGQLYVDGDLPGNKLYLCGNGVVFQHVENWLGTSRLPLTESGSELQGLCEYLDQQDEAYQAFKEVLWEFLLRKKTPGVATFSVYKVVKVYVGTHWYATYFKTLLKYPELLSNVKKTSWIVFGESLLVKGDGQMFRHVLNFLRCGRLLLPSEFREWQLLLQEIEDFQIPSLSGALEDCTDYRAWIQSRGTSHKLSSSSAMPLLVCDGERGISCSGKQVHVVLPDVAFACFSLSYEEILYGRQCHAFLTGVILDSVRLQDSQDNTMKIANLVYSLWTRQTEVEGFVSELMRIISPGRPRQRELLQRWLKLTLTVAQRYTSCLELLGRPHCRTIALFPGERTAPVSLVTAVRLTHTRALQMTNEHTHTRALQTTNEHTHTHTCPPDDQ